jgi:hypothetical protein
MYGWNGGSIVFGGGYSKGGCQYAGNLRRIQIFPSKTCVTRASVINVPVVYKQQNLA